MGQPLQLYISIATEIPMVLNETVFTASGTAPNNSAHLRHRFPEAPILEGCDKWQLTPGPSVPMQSLTVLTWKHVR